MRRNAGLVRPAMLALACTVVVGQGCELFSSASPAAALGDIDLDANILPDVVGAPIGPDGLPIVGHRYGEDCLPTDPCRPGLVCEGGSSTCVPSGEAAEGDLCTISGECAEGLSCGLTARCEPAVENPEGAQCTSPTECGPGLRCDLVGFFGFCGPEGTVDVGGECTSNADCLAPLGCSPDLGTCQLAVFGGLQFMPDEVCEPAEEDEPFRVYFEVPRDEPLPDFFRLPFPNDIRAPNGSLDLSGFPDPGAPYIAGDVLELYLDALERDFNGFSTNPTIYFRFNQEPDIGSVDGGATPPTLRFVNIDPDSPNFGNGLSFYWSTTNGRRKLICQNYVAIRPAWTSPLEHGTTYAVILTDGIRSADGDIPLQSSDLQAVLGDAEPSEPALRTAWASYAPLRAWLAEDETLDAINVAGAAVFTTADPDDVVPALRDAVRDQTAAGFDNLVQCEAGTISPCEDGTEARACVSTSGNFVQIHGTYQAPIWQRGTRPYLTEDQGGDLDVVGGVPRPAGTETMCVAMTIPTGTPPEGGWPVVLYSHGTGGSYTSFIREGVASALANISLPDARTARFATIGIDGVQHGNRRGDSDLDPEPLFYNFINPRAAHGNVQQGMADLFFLTHLLETNPVIAAGDSPTGNEIRFDPTQLFFFGHSQGSQVGAGFVAYEPAVKAAVFSGSGGSITLSLLNKTEPVDIAGAVNFVLSDGGRGYPVDDRDVILSLLQWHVDRVDPLNVARLYFRANEPERVPQHVLFTYGYRDSYSPEPNQKAVMGASGAQLATPFPGTLDGLPTTTYPISGNRTSNGVPVTAAVIAVEPTDYDGHFVVFRDTRLNRQMREFLGTALLDGVPTITAP